MTRALGVDFGTSNSVVCLWDEARGEGMPVHVPDYGRERKQGNETISVIPSLIHYVDEKTRWVGHQVIAKRLYGSRQTFRWMKQYINHRSPLRVRVNGHEITPFTAGQDFLSGILTFAAQQVDLDGGETAFSVPVEAYEHYENWLAVVAEKAGIARYRLIDEPSAAALGYGAHIQPGNVYLIFDFGGGTLHASVILMEAEERALTGRRCRVLGKAGRTLGGSRIDQWIFEEILNRNQVRDSEEDIRRVSTALLVEAERIKETLSFEDCAAMQPLLTDSGRVLEAEFTRAEFEDLLDQRDLFTEIGATIRSALNAARERGYGEEQVQSVLMVGGSSQIPSVQRYVRQMFRRDKVQFNRPLDAVARGAAAYAAGVDFFDHIQHDYAIRYVDPQKGAYDYRVIVNKGTPYPTREPVARLSIKPSYDGQRQLGLAIFEIGEQHAAASQSVELVFDPTGAARIMPVTPQEARDRSLFWMNESNPTFLPADPPAQEGEPRYEVEFHIDSNKRLTITAHDLVTGKLAYQNHPVVRLT